MATLAECLEDILTCPQKYSNSTDSYRHAVLALLTQLVANGGGVTGASAVTPTETDVDVTASSTSILAADATRKGGWIQNNSASGVVWVRLGAAAAVVGEGTRLGPGDSLQLAPNGNPITSAINGISESGTVNLNVVSLA